MKCTLYIVHMYILYMCIVHMFIVHMYNVHGIFYIVHYTLYTCTLYIIQYIMYITYYNIHMYNVNISLLHNIVKSSINPFTLPINALHTVLDCSGSRGRNLNIDLNNNLHSNIDNRT